jgi:hypothetical protein
MPDLSETFVMGDNMYAVAQAADNPQPLQVGTGGHARNASNSAGGAFGLMLRGVVRHAYMSPELV